MEVHPFEVLMRGGPVMVPLAITSLLLYKTIIGLLIFVRRARFDELSEENLAARLRALPADAAPAEAMQVQVAIFDHALRRFKQLVRGRMRYSHALLVAAPLLGLLGTVMGMLDTFHGLSLQLGRETARAVADGISRALITTETGLMIAIPGIFLLHWIKRELQRHEFRILDRKRRLLSQLENASC